MYTKDKGFKFYDRIEKKKLFQIFKKILKKKNKTKTPETKFSYTLYNTNFVVDF